MPRRLAGCVTLPQSFLPATYLMIGGWPAMQRRVITVKEQPGEQIPGQEQQILKITTAIAAGDLLIRAEGRMPPDIAGAFTALTGTSLVVGSPTGGSQGTGSINAQAIYVQGVSLSATSNYNAASVAITGGTINGAIIGGSTPAAGTFTTLAASSFAPSSLVVGSPTGGNQGAGTINAAGIYANGVQLSAANNYNAASVAITGGTINGVSIGGSTPAAGSFTALSASGGGTINNTIIGGATAAAGTFTTLKVTGTTSAAVLFGSSSTMNGAIIWNPAATVPYLGIYAAGNSLTYALAVSLPPPAGVAAIGGLQHDLGVAGSSSNTGSGILGSPDDLFKTAR
jgi:hypothetical protein